MDKKVISDVITTLIGDKQVVSAVFTTYNFEPFFFEVDVIPYLLPSTIPYSNDDRVKQFQVMEAIRESDTTIEVYCDYQILKQNDQSPNMDYVLYPVNIAPHAFHSKNIYILLEDSQTKDRFLLLGAGSNNITRAGWWENIESQHWEIVSKENNAFLAPLILQDLEWLKANRVFEKSNHSLETIVEYVSTLPNNDKSKTQFYFDIESKSFPKFIVDNIPDIQQMNLEIISPFFANDNDSNLHQIFLNMGVDNIKLLLPEDQDGNAICEQAYYLHISRTENVDWSKWNDSLTKSLMITKENQYRKLHAKIFHFYNDVESWIFSGSVNFTNNAFYNNVETGFLVKSKKQPSLLETIRETKDVSFITELNEPELSHNEKTGNYNIFISYDWKTKELHSKCQSHNHVCLELVSPSGEPLTDRWIITSEYGLYEGTIDRLEATLRNSGFLHYRIFIEDNIIEDSTCVFQTGWSHKPVDLPDLTPSEIIMIYAGMSKERRQLLLLNAKVKSFLMMNIGVELTAPDQIQSSSGFIAEFAEIFHAFRQLKSRLSELLAHNNDKQLDYYLTGTGPDSFPTLIQKTEPSEDEQYNVTTAYLILLIIEEIYSQSEFKNRINVKQKLKKTRSLIKTLERPEYLSLRSGTDRKAFFKWFKEQFARDFNSDVEVKNE